MGYYTIEPDGTVISSSQHQVYADINTRMCPMTGVILAVNPSDDETGNLTGGTSPVKRGIRHECIVWAGSDYGDPDTIITNVIIPPRAASGIDNYEEELPRGCINLIDGSVFDLSFANLDPAKLDGEWCVVDFIGGRIEYPFITNWWPHPSNNFDPSTSGTKVTINPSTEYLKQVDRRTGRSRSIKLRNGYLEVINKRGDYYISTAQSGRKVLLKNESKGSGPQSEPLGPENSGRFTVVSAKGGNFQQDVKHSAQREINFNTTKPTDLPPGAGSTSENIVHDEDLPHYKDPTTASKPVPRETIRTTKRTKEFSDLTSTSRWNIYAKDSTSEKGGKSGEATIVADSRITLTVNGSSATMITIKDNEVLIVNQDGTLVEVSADTVQAFTKSGGVFSLKGKKLSIGAEDGIITTTPVQMGFDGPDSFVEPAMKAGSWALSWIDWGVSLNAFLTLVVADLTKMMGGNNTANTAALTKVTQATATMASGVSPLGAAFSWISKQVKIK